MSHRAPNDVAVTRSRTWLPAMLVILLAIMAAYWRSSSAPFIFDDYPGIERNTSIRQLWPPAGPLNPPVTAAGAAGRPIVNLTLALDYAVGGLNPASYHRTNVALHAMVALLLFAVLGRTLRRIGRSANSADAIATVIAGLWAVHPLTTESVVCVIQRNELLVSLFLLGTLYGLARAAVPESRASVWLAGSVASCLLGMASKETMIGAPLIAFLYDRTFLAGSFADAWRARWRYYLGLAATLLLLAYLVFSNGQRAGTVGFGLGTSSWEYLVTQAHAIALYLKLCLWPNPLVLDYGFELAPGLVAVWPEALLILGLLAATIVSLRRAPAVGFLGACFFILLAPSSSVVPLTTQTIAEHRMYLPVAVVVAAFVLVVARIIRRPAWLVIAAAVPFIGLTATRVATYRSEKAIWTDTLAKRPDNARAWSSLAHVAVQENRWDDAVRLYDKAITLRPDYADTQNDYANVLLHEGRRDDALAHYRAARRLKPRDNDIQFNYAGALVQAGDLDGAYTNLNEVLARDPKNARALNNLGDLALKLDHTDEALAAFNAAVALDPDSATAHNNAAVALMRLGRYAEAVKHYEAALRQMKDSALIHHNLALALDGAGRLADSAEQEREALRLDPNTRGAREHLANLQQRLDAIAP